MATYKPDFAKSWLAKQNDTTLEGITITSVKSIKGEASRSVKFADNGYICQIVNLVPNSDYLVSGYVFVAGTGTADTNITVSITKYLNDLGDPQESNGVPSLLGEAIPVNSLNKHPANIDMSIRDRWIRFEYTFTSADTGNDRDLYVVAYESTGFTGAATDTKFYLDTVMLTKGFMSSPPWLAYVGEYMQEDNLVTTLENFDTWVEIYIPNEQIYDFQDASSYAFAKMPFEIDIDEIVYGFFVKAVDGQDPGLETQDNLVSNTGTPKVWRIFGKESHIKIPVANRPIDNGYDGMWIYYQPTSLFAINGSLIAKQSIIAEKINANTIFANHWLRVGTTEATSVHLSSIDDDYRIWVGAEDPANATFKVDKNGVLYATDGYIGDAKVATVGENNTITESNMAIYVSHVSDPIPGSDTTGDGTILSPYATLTRAIEDIPTLIAHQVYIYCNNVATLTGATISNRYNRGGAIYFESYSYPITNAPVTGIGAVDCTVPIYMHGLDFYISSTSGAGVAATESTYVLALGCSFNATTLSAGYTGALARRGSVLAINNAKAPIGNTCDYAVRSADSQVYIDPDSITNGFVHLVSVANRLTPGWYLGIVSDGTTLY